jgi:hypothetical protein
MIDPLKPSVGRDSDDRKLKILWWSKWHSITNFLILKLLGTMGK